MLVSSDKLISELCREKVRCVQSKKRSKQVAAGRIEKIIQWIRNQKSVDAVPVVRCKDCKYAIPKMGGIVCDRFGRTTKRKDDFCSYGETP